MLARVSKKDINQVYLLLLKSILFIPTRKDYEPTEEEPFIPLFAKVDDHFFLMAFDTEERLAVWAGDRANEINYVEISGNGFAASHE